MNAFYMKLVKKAAFNNTMDQLRTEQGGQNKIIYFICNVISKVSQALVQLFRSANE